MNENVCTGMTSSKAQLFFRDLKDLYFFFKSVLPSRDATYSNLTQCDDYI